MPEIAPFVFLGGTTRGYDWRADIIKLIHGDCFNPIVAEWTEAEKRFEDHAKAMASVHLYVITPDMHGIYSIAELTEAAILYHDRTVVCFVEDLVEMTWTEHQHNSNAAVLELVRRHGAQTAETLEQAATLINRLLVNA